MTDTTACITYKITTGQQGLKFLERHTAGVYGGQTVARIINHNDKGRWFATPAAWVDGALRNTDTDVMIDVTRLHHQHDGPARIAEALGL